MRITDMLQKSLTSVKRQLFMTGSVWFMWNAVYDGFVVWHWLYVSIYSWANGLIYCILEQLAQDFMTIITLLWTIFTDGLC